MRSTYHIGVRKNKDLIKPYRSMINIIGIRVGQGTGGGGTEPDDGIISETGLYLITEDNNYIIQE